MRVSPIIYNTFVHPKIFTKVYGKKLSAYVDIRDKKVLDFGCGTGNNCILFDSSKYLGIDIDSDRIKYARKLNSEYNFKVVDSNLKEIKDSSYDRILISAVLHHISDSDINDYIDDFKRILKPDGQIMIYEPYYSADFKIGNWVMKTFDEGEYIRNEQQYLKLFEKDFNSKVHTRFKMINFYKGIFFTLKLKE